MINIDELTIGQARELAKMMSAEKVAGNGTSIKVGGKYLCLTLGHYYAGRVVAITDTDIVLNDCTMIYGAGVVSAAVKSGKWEEADEQTMNGVILQRGAIVATIAMI